MAADDIAIQLRRLVRFDVQGEVVYAILECNHRIRRPKVEPSEIDTMRQCKSCEFSSPHREEGFSNPIQKSRWEKF